MTIHESAFLFVFFIVHVALCVDTMIGGGK